MNYFKFVPVVQVEISLKENKLCMTDNKNGAQCTMNGGLGLI